MSFNGKDLEHINSRRAPVKREEEYNPLPFSDELPDFISDRFQHKSPYFRETTVEDYIGIRPKHFRSGGKISVERTRSILDGETSVYQITGENNRFNVYGEIETRDADNYISHFELVSTEDSIREASRRFRESAIISKK